MPQTKEALPHWDLSNVYSGLEADDFRQDLTKLLAMLDQLDAAVEEVLADLRKGGPSALGFAKRLVREVPLMAQKDAFAWTSQLSGELFRPKRLIFPAGQ